MGGPKILYGEIPEDSTLALVLQAYSIGLLMIQHVVRRMIMEGI